MGIPLPNGRGNQPLRPEWRAFASRLTPEQREILLPLIHWTNNADLDPPNVTSVVIERFSAAHLTGRNPKSAMQTVRRIAEVWNEVASASGAQRVDNPIPYADRGRYAFGETEFAPHLLAQLDEAVRIWTTVPRRGRKLSPKVAAHKRYLILLTLSAYCHATGAHPSHIHSIEEFLDDHQD